LHLHPVDHVAAAVIRIRDVDFREHRRISESPGMGRILREQRWRRRSAAGSGLVMKAVALLVKPDIAGYLAKDQAASLLRIAIVGRGINIEPNAIHVGEIAAELTDHLMAFAFCVEA